WQAHPRGLAERQRLIPAYVLYWQTGAFKIAWIDSDDALVGFLSHLRLPHPKGFGDCDLMRGFLNVETLAIPARATHHKRTRRNPHIRQAIFWVDLLRAGNRFHGLRHARWKRGRGCRPG